MTTPLQRLLLALTLGLPLLAGPAAAAERALDVGDSSRLEVRHSMIGFRDTLLFYTFAKEKAVLRLHIGNKDDSFPVSGTVYLFPEDTTEEGLKKWLNNQHSDGLFPEVPTPAATHRLPEGHCFVAGKKLLGEKKNPTTPAMFRDFEITVSVKAHKVEGEFQLAPFTARTGVFVKK